MRDKITAFAHAVHQIIERIDALQQGGQFLWPVEINIVTANVGQVQLLEALSIACRRQHLMSLLT
ncbi:hypothetical protein D3C78_1438590 [compost metagenome]